MLKKYRSLNTWPLENTGDTMSKIFLSFLGTNRYIECNFVYERQKAEKVRFVQEALLQFFAADFGPEDKIFIFLTEEAKQINWLSTNTGLGLDAILRQKELSAKIIPVHIPRGDSEKEIWDIFHIVFGVIEPHDEVIFDITHGFRSLPMLGLVLLNYSRMLKNIRIRGIYYGAFEVLGPANKVEEMPLEQRNAPIFDLTSFETLQQWTVGADNFIHFGNSKKLASLIKDEITPLLRQKKGKDQNLNNLNKLSDKLNQVAGLFQTNRGRMIYEGLHFEELKQAVQDIKDTRYKALNPILEVLEKKLQDFRRNDMRNGFAAVRWCIDHDLIQQGITLLQETVISLLLQRNKKSTGDRSLREAASSALAFIKKPIPPEQWNKNARQNRPLIEQIKADPAAQAVAPYYEKLSASRNSINHGGYLDNKAPAKFRERLTRIFDDIQQALRTFLNE